MGKKPKGNPCFDCQRNRECFTYLTFLLMFLWSFILGHWHGRRFSVATLVNHAVLVEHQALTPDGTFRTEPKSTTAPFAQDRSSSKVSRKRSDGWHTIRVFHSDTGVHLRNALNSSKLSKAKKSSDNNNNNNKAIWFAHKKQDMLVLGLLRNKQRGYFIDLAANDAIATSNTLALELNANWTGLCIEPNPFYWYALAYYRTCHVVAAVVGRKRMEPVHFRYKGMWGGIVGDQFDNHEQPQQQQQQPPNVQKGDLRIQLTVPLLDVFQLYQVPRVIDYLNLDVEGAEEFILQHFPFSQYKFSILTVERPKDTLSTLLNQSGYVFLKQIAKWGETIWAHTSIIDQLDLSVLKNIREPKR